MVEYKNGKKNTFFVKESITDALFLDNYLESIIITGSPSLSECQKIYDKLDITPSKALNREILGLRMLDDKEKESWKKKINVFRSMPLQAPQRQLLNDLIQLLK